jgi:hypothetical protein
MRNNPIDRLVLEWAYRCEKGYPDINNEQDKKVLKEVMKELGIDLQESVKISTGSSELTKKDLDLLVQGLKSVKEVYAKYLAVFYYFDPNSLGTISEVILAKLLDSVEGIEAVHTGGAQNLEDLVVNGKKISLKTTARGKHVNLGSDTVVISAEDQKKVVEILKKLPKGTLANHTVRDLDNVVDENTYNSIVSRLQSVASKISGSSQDDFFVWVQKEYKKVGASSLLSALKIHIINYDREEVLQEFLDNKLYITEKAWGLQSANTGEILIQADLTGKLLNVTPTFIDKSTKEGSVIRVDLDTAAIRTDIDPQKVASEKLFAALDTIYKELIGSSD